MTCVNVVIQGSVRHQLAQLFQRLPLSINLQVAVPLSRLRRAVAQDLADRLQVHAQALQ